MIFDAERRRWLNSRVLLKYCVSLQKQMDYLLYLSLVMAAGAQHVLFEMISHTCRRIASKI